MIEVLIVDDDPMVSQINAMYLSEIKGFNLAGVASSVSEATNFIENNSVDLILLDIYMPERDGLSLLSYIRKSQKDIDVIVISAASDTQTIHKALQNGAADYIIKPFQLDRFKHALLTYSQKNRVILEQSELDQKELDQLLLDFQSNNKGASLPKGLTKDTLIRIWNYILHIDKDFSTELLAENIGISRISIRKYLTFLEKISVLKSYTSHGGIGRPLTMFKVVQAKKHKINPYLKE